MIKRDKSKYGYGDYGTTVDEKCEQNFNSNSAGNVITFDVANIQSSYTDNRKNNFLSSGEGYTFGINRNFGAPKKKFSINFSKAKTKFCLRLHYKDDNSYLLVKG